VLKESEELGMRNEELKPCPFCGGKDISLVTICAGRKNFYYVTCCDCGIFTVTRDNETDCIKIWNRRANDE